MGRKSFDDLLDELGNASDFKTETKAYIKILARMIVIGGLVVIGLHALPYIVAFLLLIFF